MEHIETIELTSSQSSITFSSIPQDYDDLIVLVSGRSDRSATSDGLKMELNSSSSNFSRVRLVGNGSSASTSSSSDNFVGQCLAASTSTSNTFGSTQIYISNYTLSQSKSISVEAVSENNSTTAFQELLALLWSNNSAITSISFVTTNSANFVTGSIISLFGVTAGGSGTVTTS